MVCNCKHESRSIMVSRLRIPTGLIKQTMAELRRLEGPPGKLFISSLSYRMRVINLYMPHLLPSSEPPNPSHPSTHPATKTGLTSSFPLRLQLPALALLPFQFQSLQAQRAPLDHQRHDLVQHVGGGHGGQLGIGVVGRGDLDNVGRDEVDALEAANDGAQLARGPAARLGRAGRGGN